MSYSDLSEPKKRILWAKTAGRCQYKGCNKLLYKDDLTNSEMNIAYHAHVIGDSSSGPRGHEKKSDELGSDMSNIMLLCDIHHRLIDKEKVEEHTPELLYKMKKDHEDRVKRQTSVIEDMQSHMLIYEVEVGGQHPQINSNKCLLALQEDGRYLADIHPVKLSPDKGCYKDHQEAFWDYHKDSLNSFFEKEVKDKSYIKHKSIYAIAPQPLLIQLGSLLYDFKDIEVYKKHRKPIDTWKWPKEQEDIAFNTTKPNNINAKQIALSLSLSGTITEKEITNVLGEDIAVWDISIGKPSPYAINTKESIQEFAEVYRQVLDKIKATHGNDKILNVFPAVSNAIAIEVGRNRMPKADLPFIVYDRNNNVKNGFMKTIEIS